MPAFLPMPSQPAEAADSGKKARRQQALLQLLETTGYVSVEEISDRFQVTTQTARRDIADLSATGRVRRHHGGVALATAIDVVTYRQRRIDRIEAKRRIAQRVASVVQDGAAIYLDCGTTCEAIAEALTQRSGLKIVTCNLRAASLLGDQTDFTIAVPGGFVRNADGSVFGEDAAEFIRRFRFDLSIISVSGVELDGRLADDDYQEMALARVAIGISHKVVLAVDAYKFGRSGLVELGTLEGVSMLITDAVPPQELLTALNENDVALHTC
ncbi:DeoR/GlpR family DNA-binding transcription regulator [Pseudomonas rhizoryzae]|uniref:DeoR/GlpR family DNA-binding transcription regulator n=1 Tax=Pseudomonas rhizoryzae TaxID=2571129 RepID=UPI000AFB7387|nr:DeoR/GlpR family DNA-binding transcription regulator [Pseudomonas rhizoryzae]